MGKKKNPKYPGHYYLKVIPFQLAADLTIDSNISRKTLF